MVLSDHYEVQVPGQAWHYHLDH